ncbi:competence protein ComEC [Glutamicibacter uratoxydans]|uniref:Competence protein ComEC n=1 Tax=Glutamicibacter uratoxydans TaxID=43667 RepID=A0A4Y4DQ53_GLUUR|nr:ComEC/Rec2 family competence protein [Glutamicibacter uratoxydans]GED04691.1 competence protein ComEC [Glutamicibacter uratoxydans]
MRTDFRGLWFLAGVWLTAYLRPGWPVMLAVLVLFALLFALLLRHQHEHSYAAPWFTGPLLLLLASLAAAGSALGATECTLPDQGEQQRRIQVAFDEPAELDAQGQFSGAGRILSYQDPAGWHSCQLDAYISSREQLPPEASGFTAIATLRPAQDSGSFQWWVRLDTAAQATGWQRPGPAQNLKARFSAQLEPLSQNARGLLPGMLYGDRSAQSEELQEAMKGSGLSHLTAVSGSNIALVGSMAMLLLRLLGIPRVLSTVLLLLVLAGFVGFVGTDPSVLRAGLMGAVASISLLTGRGQGSLGILSFCASALLLFDAGLAADPAFALSVLATAGIIMLAPALTDLFANLLPSSLAEMTAICCSAQFTCLPVVIALNSGFSLYSLPANLLVAPLLPMITLLGVAAVLLCTAAPPAAFAISWLISWPAELIGRIAQWAVQLPGAARPWPHGASGVALAVGISMVFTILVIAHREVQAFKLRRTAQLGLGVLAVFLGALVVPATLWWPAPDSGAWNIAMCDVGQGDALVIRTSGADAWLIDTGPPGAPLLQCLRQLQVESLSKVFITHSDNDHRGGLEALEGSGIPIGQRLVSAGFPAELWKDPQVLNPGDGGGDAALGYTVIGPDPQGIKYAEPNDTSLVLRFSFAAGDRTVDFFTAGDMEQQAMHRLLAEHPQAPAAILKASHHGARNGGVELIQKIHPAVFLVSVGADNTYGHPNAAVIDAARGIGAQVLRTDQQGTVLLSIAADGVHTSSLGAPIR